MAVLKLSQIAAGAAPATTDTFIGVQGGTTDAQFTGAQVQTLVLGKYTLTQPATGATLAIADTKTLTVSNTLTLAGTDSSTLNIGAGGTLASGAFAAAVTGANPTATAGPTAVNGTATTYMRSDAAPAIQKATNSIFGIVEVDGTTITASGGVISAAAGAGPFLPLSGGTLSGLVNFPNSDIALIGSSTGKTTFTSANAGASNFTLTFPAVTDTLAVLGTAQTFTANQLFPAGSATTPGVAVGVTGTGLYSVSTTTLGFSVNGASEATLSSGGTFSAVNLTAIGTVTASGNILGIANNSKIQLGSAFDTTLSRAAAATWQFGAADAAAPVAQSIFFQNVLAGTSNTSGANATIQGSLSTGSGVSGDIIFKVGGTGAAATVQNTAITGLTIKGATGLVYTNSATQVLGSKTTITGGATGNTPTLTAGPVTGNPTKWLPYDDNGTTRYVPAW